MKNLQLWAVCLCLTLAAPGFAQEDDHDDRDSPAAHQEEGHADADEHGDEDEHGEGDDHGDEEEEGGSVAITPEQQQVAGIVVEPLVTRRIAGEITAPGEVKLNTYLTSKVTPRITAQVMARDCPALPHQQQQQQQRGTRRSCAASAGRLCPQRHRQ